MIWGGFDTQAGAVQNLAPFVVMGALAAATADGTELFPANIDDHDWLGMSSRQLASIDGGAGMNWSTSMWSGRPTLDSAGARVLSAGEQVFMVWSASNSDLTPQFDVLLVARVLVLLP